MVSSYLDEHFESTWEFLEDTLKDLKSIFEGTKQHRIDDAKIIQLYAIAREARFFQSSRRDIEKSLQSGKAPTDEQVRGVRVFEERLFRELDHLTRLEDEEITTKKGEEDNE